MNIEFNWSNISFFEESKTEIEDKIKTDLGTHFRLSEKRELAVSFKDYNVINEILSGYICDKKGIKLETFFYSPANNGRITYDIVLK